MEDHINHSYNTRFKQKLLYTGNIKLKNNYNKPKFTVNISGNRNSKVKEKNYKIIIGNLVNMSNKLLERQELKEVESDVNTINKLDKYFKNDPDYIEHDKAHSDKYVKYTKKERSYFNTLNEVEKKKILKIEKLIKKLK